MTVRTIVKYPDPILKKMTEPVTDFDRELHRLLDDMVETMHAAEGIGLAAPQIGLSHRIAVIDISRERDQRLELINPSIVSRNGVTDSEEGCLSIPDYRDTIKRSKEIVVAAQDRHGEPIELQADELLAICLQHEIDHLDGILFVDHLSRLKRELFRRWLKKRAKDEAEADATRSPRS